MSLSQTIPLSPLYPETVGYRKIYQYGYFLEFLNYNYFLLIQNVGYSLLIKKILCRLRVYPS